MCPPPCASIRRAVKTVKNLSIMPSPSGEAQFRHRGSGSNGRLEMELFLRQAGINLVHFPTKGRRRGAISC